MVIFAGFSRGDEIFPLLRSQGERSPDGYAGKEAGCLVQIGELTRQPVLAVGVRAAPTLREQGTLNTTASLIQSGPLLIVSSVNPSRLLIFASRGVEEVQSKFL